MMNAQSIQGYARALSALDRALFGHIDGERQALLFDRACENPLKASAEFVRLARTNGVMDEATSREVSEGLDMVDLEDGDDGSLDVERQGAFILAWFRSERNRNVGRMTTAEAAKELGITTAAVSAAIGRGDIEAEKVRGQWSIDAGSVAAYRGDR